MLVTGGAGFIGANFVHRTVSGRPEYEVTVLDALTYAGNRESLASVGDAVRFVHGDVCDADLVDRLVRAWVRSFDINATLSNCANNYGPYQHVEKFIPRQITNVLVGQRPKLYGVGENVREWTHVDDHNDAVHLILDRGRYGETYLIGSGYECSNAEILRNVLELMDEEPDAFDLVPDRPGHDLRYSNDSTKIRSELGWQPRYAEIDAGLDATIEWYRDNDWWWKPQKDATEAKYNVLGR